MITGWSRSAISPTRRGRTPRPLPEWHRPTAATWTDLWPRPLTCCRAPTSWMARACQRCHVSPRNCALPPTTSAGTKTQKAVTVHMLIKQLLHFGFALQTRCDVNTPGRPQTLTSRLNTPEMMTSHQVNVRSFIRAAPFIELFASGITRWGSPCKGLTCHVWVDTPMAGRGC